MSKILWVEVLTSRILSYKRGEANIFKDFPGYFRFAMMLPHWVVGGLESAAESSLSGDDSETNTKGLIRATHHCKSIFHLL